MHSSQQFYPAQLAMTSLTSSWSWLSLLLAMATPALFVTQDRHCLDHCTTAGQQVLTAHPWADPLQSVMQTLALWLTIRSVILHFCMPVTTTLLRLPLASTQPQNCLTPCYQTDRVALSSWFIRENMADLKGKIPSYVFDNFQSLQLLNNPICLSPSIFLHLLIMSWVYAQHDSFHVG